MVRVCGVAALTLLASACGGGPSVGPRADDDTVTISGIVVEGSSTPLPGALVEIIGGPQAGGAVVTGADGRFSMPGVPAGGIVLRASKTNYSTVTQGAVVAPTVNSPFRFALEPFNPVAVNIVGRVTDGEHGVAGARIGIRSPVNDSTLSDATGAYTLALSVRGPDPARPGAWWGPQAVRAEKEDHEPDERWVTLAARTPIDFRLHRTIYIAPGASLALEISTADPSCDEVFTFDALSWPCRVVRITPQRSGTLTLGLESDEGAEMGLQGRDRDAGMFCCEARQSGPVVAGREMVVDILLMNRRRPPSDPVSVRLRTSLVP